MKEKFVSFFLSKKLKKKNKNRKIEILGAKNVKNVLVVTNRHQPELINFTSQTFSGAKTTILCKGNKKLKEALHHNTVILNAADFGINGSIKNDELLSLIQIPFDILIDLSKDDDMLTYIISKINTKLIIGSSSDENQSKIHDIFVPETGNDETFISQVKETLNLISNQPNE